MNPPGHKAELACLLRQQTLPGVNLRVVLGVGHDEEPTASRVDDRRQPRGHALLRVQRRAPDQAHDDIAHGPRGVKRPQRPGVEARQLPDVVDIGGHRHDPVDAQVHVVILRGAGEGKGEGCLAVLGRGLWLLSLLLDYILRARGGPILDVDQLLLVTRCVRVKLLVPLLLVALALRPLPHLRARIFVLSLDGPLPQHLLRQRHVTGDLRLQLCLLPVHLCV
mmetsp:Transcript_57210/g.177804  ORF Transcript_57210/g.177804 Transcript_57210/m.177804 type:complete len:222 (-) Transcript_57210:582-1247(-)